LLIIHLKLNILFRQDVLYLKSVILHAALSEMFALNQRGWDMERTGEQDITTEGKTRQFHDGSYFVICHSKFFTKSDMYSLVIFSHF
jgi:hypothetical protein